MGVENNECVIATTWSDEHINKMQEWINALVDEYQELFAFIPSLINGKTTIVLAPDGSKKGWDEAERGKDLRDDFISKLESFDYEDGSNPFDWVEVGYGEFGQKILRGNCKNRYSNKPYVA